MEFVVISAMEHQVKVVEDHFVHAAESNQVVLKQLQEPALGDDKDVRFCSENLRFSIPLHV
jgi:hypothetical protein